MPIIDVGMTHNFFRAIMRIQLTRFPLVPFPDLPELLGPARLIAGVSWLDEPAIEPASATDIPGTITLRVPASIQHLSIAELEADASAAGQTWRGDVLVRVRPMTGRLQFEMASVQAQGGQLQHLSPPRRIGDFVLPEFDLTSVAPAQIARGEQGVYLRMLSASGGTPQEFSSPLPEITGQWSINVPKECFTELIRGFLAGVADPAKNIAIEETPVATWVRDGDKWGVNAGVGIVKKDACPALFEDVDISVDLTVKLRLVRVPVDEPTMLRLELRLDANGSDWDAFRCWLGTLGLAGLVDIFKDPDDPDGWHELFYIPRTIGGLVFVGRQLAGDVSEQVQGQSLEDQGFEKKNGQEEWAEFESMQRVPIIAGQARVDMNDGGMVIWGPGFIFGTATHDVTFTPPAPGPLGGQWSWKVNCSTRSMDLRYDVLGVLIRDRVVLPNGDASDAPVTVYPTSTALANAWSVNIPFTSATSQVVTTSSHTAVPGSEGTIFIHTSAGLRRFDIQAVPDWAYFTIRTGLGGLGLAFERRAFGTSLKQQDQLLQIYCDSISIPSRLVGRTELKWVEPPPDRNYGFPALKQWQVVARNLAPRQTVQVFGSDAEPIATVQANERGVALLEFVTPEGMNPVMAADSPRSGAEFRMLQRWLLPVEERPIQSTDRMRSRNLVARQFRDQDGATHVVIAARARTKRIVQSLPGGRVLVSVGDKSFIAVAAGHVQFR